MLCMAREYVYEPQLKLILRSGDQVQTHSKPSEET